MVAAVRKDRDIETPMQTNPILLFGLGGQGTEFAYHLADSFARAFPGQEGLLKGLCLTGGGEFVSLSGSPGSAPEPIDFIDEMTPGAFKQNRLRALEAFETNRAWLESRLNELFSHDVLDLRPGGDALDPVPTVFVLAPAADPIGSAILQPFLKLLRRYTALRIRQAIVLLHLVVLLPEVFQDKQVDPMADVRCFAFFSELEYMNERPAVVTGSGQAPADYTWVLGRRDESGFDLGNLEQIAARSVHLFAYLGWRRLALENGRAALDRNVKGKRAQYSTFGVARLLYPVDAIRNTISGCAESAVLASSFPDILGETPRLNDNEVRADVRRFVHDSGIDRLPELLSASGKSGAPNVVLNVSAPKSALVAPDKFIMEFDAGLEQAETAGMEDAEIELAYWSERERARIEAALTERCGEMIDTAGKGLPYAAAWMMAIKKGSESGQPGGGSSEQRASLEDALDALVAEYDSTLGLEPSLRQHYHDLRRKLAEIRARIAVLPPDKSVSSRKDEQRVAQELIQTEATLRKADAVIADPAQRRAAVERVYGTYREHISRGQAAIRVAYRGCCQTLKRLERTRRGTLASWMLLALGLGSAASLALAASDHEATLRAVVAAVPVVLGTLAIDNIWGGFSLIRKAKADADENCRRVLNLEQALLATGQGYLNERRQYALREHCIEVLQDLKADLDTRLIPAAVSASAYISSRSSLCLALARAGESEDEPTDRALLTRADIEAFAGGVRERVALECAEYVRVHRPSAVWKDIVSGRGIHWEQDLTAFCETVFSDLYDHNLAQALESSRLLKREDFRLRLVEARTGARSTLAALEPIAEQAPARLDFLGLPVAVLAGEADAGLPGVQRFEVTDPNRCVAISVKMGLPAFAISANVPGAWAAALRGMSGVSVDEAMGGCPLFPEGYALDPGAEPLRRNWVLARALASGEALNLPADFDEFCALTKAARSSVDDSVELALLQPDARARLEAFLRESIDQYDAQVVHEVLDEMEMGGVRK
jgi:hypothetical protein